MPQSDLLVLNVSVFARRAVAAALLSSFLAAPALRAVPPLVETPWQQISTSPVAPVPPVLQAPQWQRPLYQRRPRPPVVVVPPVLMPPPSSKHRSGRLRVRQNRWARPCRLSVQTVNLSGPRFGYTSLSDGVVQKLKEDRQIGSWIDDLAVRVAVRKQFYNNGDGLTILNEWVGLLGGLEQKSRHSELELAGGVSNPRGR